MTLVKGLVGAGVAAVVVARLWDLVFPIRLRVFLRPYRARVIRSRMAS